MWDVLSHKREQDSEKCTCHSGKGYALQVNERGVAYNASVGMKESEGNCIQERGENGSNHDGSERVGETYVVQFIILAYETCKQNDETIQSQDSPVGKCLSGEIPVTEYLQVFHITILNILSY
jgi:hypothetical protein